jgi:hypothetical protein
MEKAPKLNIIKRKLEEDKNRILSEAEALKLLARSAFSKWRNQQGNEKFSPIGPQPGE